MSLTNTEIEELTLEIKKTIDNFKDGFITTPLTYNCDKYESPINYPVISVINKRNRVAIININFK